MDITHERIEQEIERLEQQRDNLRIQQAYDLGQHDGALAVLRELLKPVPAEGEAEQAGGMVEGAE